MDYLKRIGMILALTLFVGGIAFSAEIKNDAAILLEEAIYTEETLGDFDKAAGIYQQIADNTESGRAPAAQALYRLGMYYQARGREAEAKAAFTRLTKQYPEQKELISRIPDFSSKPGYFTEFIPAPWEDGEVLTYRIARPTINRTSGTAIILPGSTYSTTQLLFAESIPGNEKNKWRFRTITTNGNLVTSRNFLTMDDNTLSPVEKWTWEWEAMETRTNYFPKTNGEGRSDQVRVTRGSGAKMQTFYVYENMPAVYDNEQIIYLLRCLPLQKGFEITVPIFNSYGNNSSASAVVNRIIRVDGREPVITPAGTFNAWKIAYGEKGVESYYWISDDNRRYPVKFKDSSTSAYSVVELASVSTIEKSRPLEYTDQDISFSLPPGWVAVASSRINEKGGLPIYPGPTESVTMTKFINFVDPEFETSSGFTLIEYFTEEERHLNLPETAKGQVEITRQQISSYEERPGTRENLTISGGAAIRYISDYKSRVDDGDLSVYTVLAAAGNKSLRAYFRAKKEDLDRFVPVFDSIIKSIQLRWQ
jgi:tetratricopeptide (TPR) repeat protein